MIRDWIREIFNRKTAQKRHSSCRKNTTHLQVELLEDRLAPVVGATAVNDAPVVTNVNAGSLVDVAEYRGIVRLNMPNDGVGTGSLLFTGRHILTVAHNVDWGITSAKFELFRGGNPFPVVIPISANAGGNVYQRQWISADGMTRWDGNPLHGNDIAILRLTDPTLPAQNRFLVGPMGADKYELYTGRDEVGQQFEFAGYGREGTGANGQNPFPVEPPFRPKHKGQNTFETDGTRLIHEVQAITIAGTATQGNFTLSHSGVTTANIDFNAKAADIQAALEQATDGAGNTPLLNNVRVHGDQNGNAINSGGNNYFFVEFTGQLGTAADPWNAANMGVVSALKTATGANVAINIVERQPGGSITPGSKNLSFDFDDITNPANDALGLFYGLNNLGLGNVEAINAPGDSGGPAFLKGSKQIAAVISARGYLANNQVPDVDANSANSSFGETGYFPRVSSYTKNDPANNRDNFLNETLFPELAPGAPANAGQYHIVLDMNYQVLGASNPGENIKSILAKQNGNNLEIWVDIDGDGAYTQPYEGLYFSEQASKIISLTIRGSDDNETFILDGPLALGGEDGAGLNAKIELDGGAGNDTFIIGNAASGRLDTLTTPITLKGDAGNDEATINDIASVANNTYTVTDAKVTLTHGANNADINYESHFKLTLNTGFGNDTVQVDSTSADITQWYLINTNNGADKITVGTAAAGLANDNARIFIAGGSDEDELIIEDSASTDQRTYNLAPGAGGWNGQIQRTDKLAINHSTINKVTLNTGSKADTITITATDSSVYNKTFINSGDGDDTITVGAANGLDSIASPVVIDAGAAPTKNQLTIDDRGSANNHNYNLNQRTSLTRDGVQLIEFSNVVVTRGDLRLSNQPGNNALNVIALAPGSSLDVLGGAGQDIVTVSSDTGTLDDLNGPIAILGDDNQDQLFLNDSAVQVGDGYTISAGTVTVNRLPDFALTFDNFEELSLTSGAGDDNINLSGLASAVQLALDGNLGYDSVNLILGTIYDPNWLSIEALNDLGGILRLDQGLSLEDFNHSSGTLELDLGDVFTSGQIVVSNTVALAGPLTVAPVAGFTGNDSYVLIDNQGASVVAGTFDGLPEGSILNVGGFSYCISYVGGDGNDVTLTMQTNTAPTASDDFYSVMQGQMLSIYASGILGNDSDMDGDMLTAVLVTSTTHGTLTFNSDGSFGYEPTAGFSGTDSFTYKVNDGVADSNIAIVSIEVTSDEGSGGSGGNTSPDAVDDYFSSTAGAAVNGSVLANDSDMDGNPLTATLDSQPNYGSLIFYNDGTFSYTPYDPNLSGTDSFTYTIADGQGGTDSAYAYIELDGSGGSGGSNSPPVVGDDSTTTNANTPVTINVLANDSDPDGDTLIVYAAEGSTSGATIIVNADSTITYIPPPDWTGTDTFFYTVDDGYAHGMIGYVEITVV